MYDFDIGTKPTMTYDNKTRTYTVSFIPGPDFPKAPKNQIFEVQGFADPDEDGNYPIKVGRETYLVSGEVLTLNGKKIY